MSQVALPSTCDQVAAPLCPQSLTLPAICTQHSGYAEYRQFPESPRSFPAFMPLHLWVSQFGIPPPFLCQANSCSFLKTQPRCHLFREVFPDLRWGLPKHHVLTLLTLLFILFCDSLFTWCHRQSQEFNQSMSVSSGPNTGPGTG